MSTLETNAPLGVTGGTGTTHPGEEKSVDKATAKGLGDCEVN